MIECGYTTLLDVSVLFSEPKIPQSDAPGCEERTAGKRFQCSSASRKFLNLGDAAARQPSETSFSALQRAENSSIVTPMANASTLTKFQCSSASRKFLNNLSTLISGALVEFQCSSASRKFLNDDERRNADDDKTVSVLFSEPKIPQSNAASSMITSTL